jgi:hypothetical protein
MLSFVKRRVWSFRALLAVWRIDFRSSICWLVF